MKPDTSADAPTSASAGEPWWGVGMVWLVLAGPLSAVIAGVATFVIAVRGAEPVLSHEDGRRFADRPAVQGRNHAATARPSR